MNNIINFNKKYYYFFINLINKNNLLKIFLINYE